MDSLIKTEIAVLAVTVLVMSATCVGQNSIDITKMVYKYYNKQVDTYDLDINNEASMRNVASKWKTDKPLKIITHGIQGDYNEPGVQGIKNAYLDTYDYNIIIVGWKKAIGFKPLSCSGIIKLTKCIPEIGKSIALVIKKLIQLNLVTMEKVHLIGISVGAHIMGSAGNQFADGSKIGQITGLDPAGPIFQKFRKLLVKSVLDKTKAAFVNCIHTSKCIGFSVSHCHADFWPNGKTNCQPGCNLYPDNYEIVLSFLENSLCSHMRAVELFIESIGQPERLIAWPCKNWNSFKKLECQENYVYMGDKTPSSAMGDYFLITNGESSFGKGLDGNKIQNKINNEAGEP